MSLPEYIDIDLEDIENLDNVNYFENDTKYELSDIKTENSDSLLSAVEINTIKSDDVFINKDQAGGFDSSASDSLLKSIELNVAKNNTFLSSTELDHSDSLLSAIEINTAKSNEEIFIKNEQEGGNNKIISEMSTTSVESISLPDNIEIVNIEKQIGGNNSTQSVDIESASLPEFIDIVSIENNNTNTIVTENSDSLSNMIDTEITELSIPEHLTIEDIESENNTNSQSELSDTENLLSALEIETIDHNTSENNSLNQKDFINSLTSSVELVGGANTDDLSSTSDFMIDEESEKITNSSSLSEKVSSSSIASESISFSDISSSIFQNGGFEYLSESSINNSEELPSAIEIVDI